MRASRDREELHPHACGADYYIDQNHNNMEVLHPHACGADDETVEFPRGTTRYIPTRVGRIGHWVLRTGSPVVTSPRVWGGCLPWRERRMNEVLHPHACGADCSLLVAAMMGWRYIPTRVGRMLSRLLVSRRGTLHPHACGADALRISRTRCWRLLHPHACGADADHKAELTTMMLHPHACGADRNSLS